MPSFSPEYIDHFMNPRGVGDLENADADIEVEAENGGCMDRVRLTVQIENGKIGAIKFRARACSGTIAACSALCDYVAKKEMTAARSLTSDNLADLLGGIPHTKQHSVELAITALNHALDQIETSEGSGKK